MQELVNLLIVTGIGLILLAGSYLVDLLSGIIKVIFTPAMKWSWKKFGEDLVKAILIAIATESLVALIYILNWFSTKSREFRDTRLTHNHREECTLIVVSIAEQ